MSPTPRNGPERFVSLEFTSPKVRDFLIDLRTALSGKRATTSPHITVRGPYREAPSPHHMEEIDSQLRGYGVVIGGSGTFETPRGLAVYLKAQSPVFEQIWWKPDFPEGRFGIAPHVTVLETKSQSIATAVYGFLRSEKIEIFTFGLHLSVHAAKQAVLFETTIDPIVGDRRSEWERWRVRPGIIQRAKQLRESLG